jgi:hypothetical protein
MKFPILGQPGSRVEPPWLDSGAEVMGAIVSLTAEDYEALKTRAEKAEEALWSALKAFENDDLSGVYKILIRAILGAALTQEQK